ncbi:TetR/AcrR family transcriptional regulator [Aliishimia ponticola]|uniref:TetR/AcrR family transcriptional regulator n=1 Tax=Aliishimia ponticola TaxID=2499833 RepID=A0A4V6S245_9RHOB|nr:TetR/AcrR family transcriptional regulator [Aliishimia ponticola]THH39153.1 TetR/AcrR family transcriptional regulator [Aliishimia ponticola]
MTNSSSRQPGSKDLWLDAAYEMLVSDGIDAVKIMALAKKLNLSRTGFYWFFADLKELHIAMIERWENQNTGNLVERCTEPALNICQSLFNLMDCWLDQSLFDARLDLAIRNWARVDDELQIRVNDADRIRIDTVAEMFQRHGFPPDQAHVRSLTVIYTQIGYISMQTKEALPDRLARVPHYVEIFSGTVPSSRDVEVFLARHI